MIVSPRTAAYLTAALLMIAAGEPPGGDIVAQRGDVRMTGADLQDTLSLLDPATRTQVAASAPALAAFARERVLNLAVIAEAKAKGWDKQPDVMRRINEARDAVIEQTYLNSVVPPDPAYPSEAEITSTYQTNKVRLMVPKQYHLAQIVLLVKPNATAQEEAEAQKKAVELRAQAVKPKADFAELARTNSQDTGSADKGGEVGWLREPDMIPAVREAVASLTDNGISQPTRVPDGWHILKLLETKAPAQVSLADARAQIVQALRQTRVQKLTREYLDTMLKAQPIQVNEIELTKQVGAGR